MALTTVEIQIGENMKRKAEAICEELEITLQTYVKLCIRELVERGYIPLWEDAPGMESWRALQREAQKNGYANMTLDEINEMIAEARAERQAEIAAKRSEMKTSKVREAVAS